MKHSATGDRSALIAGSLVNGVAAYAFSALGTRSYAAAGFAPVSIVWTIWALTVALVTFPLQHWAIRTVKSGDESDVRSALRGVAVGLLGLARGVVSGSGLFKRAAIVLGGENLLRLAWAE